MLLYALILSKLKVTTNNNRNIKLLSFKIALFTFKAAAYILDILDDNSF